MLRLPINLSATIIAILCIHSTTAETFLRAEKSSSFPNQDKLSFADSLFDDIEILPTIKNNRKRMLGNKDKVQVGKEGSGLDTNSL